MTDLTALNDLNHSWGDDLVVSTTGDLDQVARTTRSRQRVLRRLLTNPGEYLFHPEYGAGLRKMVGENRDVAKIRTLIRGQMLLEPSVSRSPEPTVTVASITNGVSVRIDYVALPDQQPVALSFNVST